MMGTELVLTLGHYHFKHFSQVCMGSHTGNIREYTFNLKDLVPFFAFESLL